MQLVGRDVGRVAFGVPCLDQAIGLRLGRVRPTIQVNSALWRLDASTELIRRARDLGVRLCISSDAHHESELDRMQFGASWATRGWADPEMVINTWAPDCFLNWIRGLRPAAN